MNAAYNHLLTAHTCWQAFDAYIGLFYIAFYELDVMKLRGELVTDQI